MFLLGLQALVRRIADISKFPYVSHIHRASSFEGSYILEGSELINNRLLVAIVSVSAETVSHLEPVDFYHVALFFELGILGWEVGVVCRLADALLHDGICSWQPRSGYFFRSLRYPTYH